MTYLNSLDSHRKARAYAQASAASINLGACPGDCTHMGCAQIADANCQSKCNFPDDVLARCPGAAKLPANTLDTQGACQFLDLSCYLRSKNLGPSVCPPFCGGNCGPIPVPCWVIAAVVIAMVVIVVVARVRR